MQDVLDNRRARLTKKIIFALLFVALISTGAFAQMMFGMWGAPRMDIQLMLGVSGALHMDTQLSASQIKARIDSGEGVFYGGFAEIAAKHLGLGMSGNVSYYQGSFDNSYTYLGSPVPFSIVDKKLVDYDLTAYLSYHLLGARKFLDPFGEFGGGVLATGFENQSDTDTIPWDGPFLAASYYWYAALGLGINLGPIGVFGKFSYNYPIKKSFQANFKDTVNGQPTYQSGSATLGPYGYQSALYPDGYLPKLRFTFGAKLIL
jgi:hypothetical protein